MADKAQQGEAPHRRPVHRYRHHWQPEARVPQSHPGVREWLSFAPQPAAVGRGRVRGGDLHHGRHLHRGVPHRPHRGR